MDPTLTDVARKAVEKEIEDLREEVCSFRICEHALPASSLPPATASSNARTLKFANRGQIRREQVAFQKAERRLSAALDSQQDGVDTLYVSFCVFPVPLILHVYLIDSCSTNKQQYTMRFARFSCTGGQTVLFSQTVVFCVVLLDLLR